MDDLLKSVLGIGKNLGDFFTSKKKDLINAFSPQIHSPIPAPKLNTYKAIPPPRPTPIKIAPPKLNQPNQNSFLTDFFKNTVTKTIPSAVKSIDTNIRSAGNQFGKGLGGAIQAQPITIFKTPITNAAQVEAMRKTNEDIASRNLKLAISLVKQGKTAQAQKLFDANTQLFKDTATKNAEFMKQLEQGKRDVLSGGIKTAMYAGGANVLSKPVQVAGAALLGGFLDKVFGGKDPYTAAGKAIGELPKYESVTQFTNPLFSAAIGRIKGVLANPVARQVVGRTLSGLAGVGENEIIGKLDQKDPTSYDRLLSFGLSAMLSSGGKAEDWTNLKKNVKQSIIDGGKTLGLDVRPAGDVWVLDPKSKDGKLPNFLYEAKHKLQVGDYSVGLSVKPKGEVPTVVEAKNALEFSKAHQNGLIDAMKGSENQDQAVNGIKTYLDDQITRLGKNPDIKAAKGLRAAINRTMFNLAGVAPENGKYEAKVFAKSFDNPEVSAALQTLESYKTQVDDVISGNIKQTGSAILPENLSKGEYLYHTTSPDRIAKISKEGMKPSIGQYGKGVYFAPDIESTKGYGSPEGAMIRIKKTSMPKGFQEFPDQSWVNKNIPAKYLEVSMDEGLTWKPITQSVEGGLNIKGMSDNTKEWLADYFGNPYFNGKRVSPDPEMLNELSKYKPKNPVKLYRGVSNGKGIMSTDEGVINQEFSSWTKSKTVASDFAGKSGKIETKVFQPDEIIVDTTLIPKKMLQDELGNMTDEAEVLVKNKNFGARQLAYENQQKPQTTGARKAEEIMQEIEAGTYKPRTKTGNAVLNPENNVPAEIKTSAEALQPAEVLGGENLKKTDFNKQMTEADKSMKLQTVKDLFDEYDKEAQASLKEKYNLRTPEKFISEQEKAKQSFTDTEQLNKDSGIPPGGLPPKAIGGEKTFGQKLKGLKDQIITSSRDLLNSMGEGGKQLAKRLDDMNNTSERMTGNFVADYGKAVSGLKDDQIENVLKFLDGQSVELNSQETVVANALRKQLNKAAEESIKSKLEIKLPDGKKVPFTPRENYLPHILDVEKLKNFRDETISHLTSTGQIKDATIATSFIDDIISGMSVTEAYQRYFGQNTPKRFGNLEFARILDFPSEVLRYDKKLLPDYLEGAAKRINEARNFGADNEILTNILNNMQKSGEDTRVASDIMDRNLGLNKENPAINQGVGAIKQVQAAMKLGLGAISNAGQSVNTATKFGIRNTIKNIFKAGSPESQDFALRSGATVESAIKQIKNEMEGAGGLDKITAPGFNLVEKFNRTVAANAGKDFVEQRFSDFLKNPKDTKVIQDLSKLIENFNPEEAIKAGQLTADQLQQAGQKAVNITQFKTRPIDLPPTWSSAWGRLLTQFKSFSYKHAQFIKNEVLVPALKREDFKPLLRYTILGLVVGEGIADLKALVRRRERPTNPTERALDNLSSVGGIGLLQDAINASQRGSEAVMSFLAGPSVSDIAKITGGVALALQGKPKTIGRFALGNIPIIGQPLANTVFPPVGAYKSRTPDLIQEGIGVTVEGDKSSASQAALNFSNSLDIGALDEQKLKDQLKNVQDQKKKIIAQKQFLGLGMNDEEKAVKIKELEDEEAVLKSSIKLQGIEDYLTPNNKTGLAKYKYEEDQHDWARKVYESNFTDEKKNEIYKKMGLDPNAVQYDYVASQPDKLKSQFILDQFEQASADHETILTSIVSGRVKSQSGKILMSNGVIDDLYDAGYISYNEAKELKKIEYDEKGNQTKTSARSTGGGSTKKPKISDIPDISTFIENSKTQTKESKLKLKPLSADFFVGPQPKIPKAPELKIEDLIKGAKTGPTNLSKARALIQKLKGGKPNKTGPKLSKAFFSGNKKQT